MKRGEGPDGSVKNSALRGWVEYWLAEMDQSEMQGENMSQEQGGVREEGLHEDPKALGILLGAV